MANVIQKIEVNGVQYELQDIHAIPNPSSKTEGQTLQYNGSTWIAVDKVDSPPEVAIGNSTPTGQEVLWMDVDEEGEYTGIVDEAIEDSPDLITSGGTWTELQKKADKSTTYTKTEVNTLITNKAICYDAAQNLTENNQRQAQANIGLGVGFYIDSDGDLCQYD